MTTSKGGRPAKVLDDEQITQTETLAAVLSLEQLADYFGIAKNTFYAIMERQPEVSERYKKGRAKAIGSIAQGLLQQARSGNTAAAMFYLKTQAGWRETAPSEGQDETPPTTITFTVAPPAAEIKTTIGKAKG